MTKPIRNDCSSLHQEKEAWAYTVTLMTISYLCTLSAPLFDRDNYISLWSKLVELQQAPNLKSAFI